MKKFISFFAAVLFAGSIMADVYQKVTSIAAGDVVVLASSDAMEEFNGVALYGSNSVGDHVAFTTQPAGAAPLTVVAGNKANTFAFKTSDNKYLGWTSGNTLIAADALSDNSSWEVTFKLDSAFIVNAADATRQIWWNVSSPRFCAYASKSHGSTYYCPSLYKLMPEPSVATPTFSPTEVNFLEQVSVSIACETEGAVIYYTLDGVDPTTSSSVYSAPIPLTETTVVKAIAVLNAEQSAVASKKFSRLSVMTVTEALDLLESVTFKSNVCVAGIVSGVGYYDDTHLSLSYYISDDGTTDNELTVYSGKGLDGADISSKQELQKGDRVTIFGNLKVYNNTKEFDMGSKILKLEPGVVTAIDNAEVANPAQKVIENGQLFIIKNGVKYNSIGIQVQ